MVLEVITGIVCFNVNCNGLLSLNIFNVIRIGLWWFLFVISAVNKLYFYVNVTKNSGCCPPNSLDFNPICHLWEFVHC